MPIKRHLRCGATTWVQNIGNWGRTSCFSARHSSAKFENSWEILRFPTHEIIEKILCCPRPCGDQSILTNSGNCMVQNSNRKEPTSTCFYSSVCNNSDKYVEEHLLYFAKHTIFGYKSIIEFKKKRLENTSGKFQASTSFSRSHFGAKTPHSLLPSFLHSIYPGK